MRKIKTKAELKSVSDFLKTEEEHAKMLPLTCGLCDKVKETNRRVILTNQSFRISTPNPISRIMRKTIPQSRESRGSRSQPVRGS